MGHELGAHDHVDHLGLSAHLARQQGQLFDDHSAGADRGPGGIDALPVMLMISRTFVTGPTRRHPMGHDHCSASTRPRNDLSCDGHRMGVLRKDEVVSMSDIAFLEKITMISCAKGQGRKLQGTCSSSDSVLAITRI